MAQNRILISAVVAVLLGFAFYNFGLKPKQKEASDLTAEVATAQTNLDAARGLLSTNEAAKGSFKRDYSTVVKLGKAVPGDDDVRSLVVQLDDSANAADVAFEAITVGGAAAAPPAVGDTASTPLPPGATVGPAGFPIMPFSFEFKGQFFGLSEFFKRLNAYVDTENKKLGITGRLLTVDGLKLVPDQSGFPNIRATVAATSYLVSPLEGVTGGATPAGPAVPVAGVESAPVPTGGGSSTTESAMEGLR